MFLTMQKPGPSNLKLNKIHNKGHVQEHVKIQFKQRLHFLGNEIIFFYIHKFLKVLKNVGMITHLF